MTSMEEIGGYLELERFDGKPYHQGAIALNCGRGCMAYLTELRGIRRIWLPDFMCGSVPALFRREGVEVLTYAVGEDLLPDYSSLTVARGEWMLLADFYGALCRQDVDRALEASRGSLIVDETQGFFTFPWFGADTVYTCRKWFGVADGAYLFTSDGATLAREIQRDESHGRMGFVLGRFERPASEFFAEASANNDFFEGEPAKRMSAITENILNAVDYESVRRRRQRNWHLLDAKLGHLNLLWDHIGHVASEAPFMYPFLVGDSTGVRELLASKGIYIPTLWPNVFSDCAGDTVASRYAKNILPLPIDQRYGDYHMKRLAMAIVETFRSLGVAR